MLGLRIEPNILWRNKAHRDKSMMGFQMKLLSVEIDGLFGRFNHRIKIDRDDRLSIVIAPNGYGKTVSLRLIRALLSLEFGYLRLVEFRRMRLNFEGNVVLAAERQRRTDKKRERTVIEVRLTENGNLKGEYESGLRDTPDRPDLASVLDSIVPHLSRVGYDRFVDDFTGRQLSTQEAFVAYEHLVPRSMLPPEKEAPPWLAEFPAKIKIRFIEAQRLISLAALERETRTLGGSPRKDRAMVVRAQSDALAERIKRTIQRFAAQSQTLEQSFPRRLVERSKDTSNVSAQAVLQSLGALNRRREQLSAVGLIDSNAHFLEIPNNDIPGHLLWVLDMYVEDTRAKFDVFNETYERLKLLTSFINSKFHFKTITTDANSGVVIRDTDTDKTIEITDLSSGEQNEIVLAFQLIFESDASTLILIDEPEISLHVAWQNQFLRDLKQVLALTKSSAIVATHSPHIIGDDWHLTNDLGRNAK